MLDSKQAAVQAGDASSVKDLLRKHDSEKDLKQMLRMVQVATHNAQWSDGERAALRCMLVAMRLWSGFSFVFHFESQ